jgi:hypothetical protein
VIKIMPETAIKVCFLALLCCEKEKFQLTRRLQFGSYEAAKRTLATLEGHDDPTRINPYSKFAAGGVAGMTAQ